MNVRTEATLWRRALRLAARQCFRLTENNDEPRPTRNGELRWVQHLVRRHAQESRGRPFVAIDGGANRGEYSRLLLETARTERCAIEVYAFEPAPVCVAELQRTFQGERAVRIVAAALGDTAGERSLFAESAGSSQGSLIRRPCFGAEAPAPTPVRVVRLEDYLAEQGLARVDLLKLDVEGAELTALQGIGALLRPESIDAIQFEYGGTTLDAGVRLRDFYALLESHGYVIAKLLPRAVEVRRYRPWMENYSYANYLALAPRWQEKR